MSLKTILCDKGADITRRLGLFALTICLFTWHSAPVQAEISIDISKGTPKPIPVAIVDFNGKSDAEQKLGRDIAKVISGNLTRSGLFRPIDKKAFIQSAESLLVQPNFADWRAINADILVFGQVTLKNGGDYRMEFHFWDVPSQLRLDGIEFTVNKEFWRRAAHKMSDRIFERITGERGMFDTEIVYIAETGPKQRRVKRLAIMDQDGHNIRYLTSPHSLALTPRFSPTAREITYLSYFNNKPRVYLFNISTGQQEVLGDFPGMTFAPRFSPDGNEVIMSLALNGNTEIYTLNLRTRKQTRITNHPAIDTSPTYSPKGRYITFNSDRGGSPQIYTMRRDGKNIKRISFGKGRFGTPVWSPRGDMIAFTRIYRGQFSIGVMRTDGSGQRILTSGYEVEAPTWSPNGRYLIYFRQKKLGGGKTDTRLYMIDLTGRNERELFTPTEASDPAWSPLIP